MTLALDPQIAAALMKMVAAMGDVKPAPIGDWRTRRERGNAMFATWARLQPVPSDVDTRDFKTSSHDGAAISMRWFRRRGAQPGSAALFVHGGGMLLGSVTAYDEIIKRYVSASGVPLLAIDYRLPPEHPYPTPMEDCYVALKWLSEHASELGVDVARIAIMGDSAGGGLAASTALMARDHAGPTIAKQILIYPMLDDRNTISIENLRPFLTWTWNDNTTGWHALLGDRAGSDAVSGHAAASRAADLSKLPATYLEVGQLDIFCAETIAYASRLMNAGVATELHVHPGANHGFELFAPDADVSRRAIADRVRAIQAV